MVMLTQKEVIEITKRIWEIYSLKSVRRSELIKADIPIIMRRDVRIIRNLVRRVFWMRVMIISFIFNNDVF